MTTVKMVAVDMDGTFLDDKKQYNRSRFLACYHQLTQRNIKFVVASGNQYHQLRSFFLKSPARSPLWQKTAH